MLRKNEKGKYNPDSIALKFNPIVSKKCYVDKDKAFATETVDSRTEFSTEKEYLNKVANMKNKADEIKQYLMDDSMVIKKILNILISILIITNGRFWGGINQ